MSSIASENEKPYLRRRLLIEPGIQLKIIGYSALMSIVFTSFLFFAYLIWQNIVVTQSETPFLFVTILFSVGLCVSGITLYLGLVVTNQVAGPVYRLRTELKRIADGEVPRKISIRDGDLLGESFKEYNRLVELLKENDLRDADR